jgi:homoserine kinase
MAINRLTFKAQLAQVSVPASSANLGAGFDTFALALDIRDRYAAQILDDAVFDVDVTGEGADEVKRDKNNLVIKAMMRGFEHMGQKPKGIALRALNVTPHGRGLGSSSSAIVGGLALARELVLGGEEYMSDGEIMMLATELEGHPDNVAAALRGGATIAWLEEVRVASHPTGITVGRSISIPVSNEIKALIFIPENTLSTNKARKLLPETVPHRDAVMNSSHAALLSIALSTRPDLLFTATEDFLHQSYRTAGFPKSMDLVTKLRSSGVAATISGAGPSVLALHTGDSQAEVAIIEAATSGFTAKSVPIARRGVE